MITRFGPIMLLLALLPFLLAACSPQPEPPTPDLRSLIVEAVSEALPTPTPTPTPDVDATVEARVQSTVAAAPTATPSATSVPTATPVSKPTPTPASPPRLALTPTAVPLPEGDLVRFARMVAEARKGVVRISAGPGTGTGFIFETAGQSAYVLTNHHVVEGDQSPSVLVEDSHHYNGRMLGHDSRKDLAVLEICCGQFHPLELLTRGDLLAGDEVLTIGYPLGLSGAASVSSGIISAVRWDSRRGAWMIQTDAPLNPGNSGGPLLLANGQVIGVNTVKIATTDAGDAVDGIGFAVSWRTVREEIPRLKDPGRAARPAATLRPTATPRSAPTAVPTPAPTLTPTPVQWQRWQNPKYSYEISVPVGWRTWHGDGTGGIGPEIAEFRHPDGADVDVVIFENPIDSPSRRIDRWIWLMGLDNPAVAVMEVLERNSEEMEAGKIAHVLYRYQSDFGKANGHCVRVILMVVAIPRQGKHWQLDGSTCESDAEEYWPVISASMESFSGWDSPIR